MSRFAYSVIARTPKGMLRGPFFSAVSCWPRKAQRPSRARKRRGRGWPALQRESRRVGAKKGVTPAGEKPGTETRRVVDISPALRLAERLAVHPHVESRQFDTAGGELAASPDLHALHLLLGRIRHGAIITVDSEFHRFAGG